MDVCAHKSQPHAGDHRSHLLRCLVVLAGYGDPAGAFAPRARGADAGLVGRRLSNVRNDDSGLIKPLSARQ
jgi:hypothetical protein